MLSHPSANVERFQFTGNASEYFGIWIVNLFLTILTLGIYSAWAKVRKKRYFYGNTWLAGTNFEYHGKPIAILKGRILAFGAFVAYTVGAQFSPKIAAAVALALMPVIPWLMLRSFAFNAVNSSYRNLRVHFNAGYREAAVAIGPAILFPVLALVMPEIDPKAKPSTRDIWIGLTPLAVFWAVYPYLIAKTRLLQVNHSRYGTAPFASTATLWQFYKIYILATVLAALLLGIFFGLGAGLVYSLPILLVVAGPLMYAAFGAILFAFTQSRVSNLVFNSTALEQRVRFSSELKARRLGWIFFTNILVVLATLGLMIPWAAIRSARYRAECLGAECPAGLESFLGEVAVNVTATGEEMGEMFDVDFSL